MNGLVHVGAHDGREYRDTARALVLIEPQRQAYNALVDTFGGCENVILRNVACGSRTGTATMRIATFRPSSSLLAPVEHLNVHPETTFDQRERVKIDTLDNIMASLGDGYGELVIDVQGYEMEVLKGAERTLAHVVRVKIEVNTVEMFKGCPLIGDLDEFFAPQFERTDTDLFGEGGRGYWGDAIYERRANGVT